MTTDGDDLRMDRGIQGIRRALGPLVRDPAIRHHNGAESRRPGSHA